MSKGYYQQKLCDPGVLWPPSNANRALKARQGPTSQPMVMQAIGDNLVNLWHDMCESFYSMLPVSSIFLLLRALHMNAAIVRTSQADFLHMSWHRAWISSPGVSCAAVSVHLVTNSSNQAYGAHVRLCGKKARFAILYTVQGVSRGADISKNRFTPRTSSRSGSVDTGGKVGCAKSLVGLPLSTSEKRRRSQH